MKESMKMKVLFVFSALALSALLLPDAWSKPVKPIEIGFGLESSSTHTRWTRVFKPWSEMVEERSKGRVKIVPYFSNSLAPRPENYNAVVQGIADMGECNLGGISGRFPILEMLHLSGVGMDTATTGCRTMWRLYQKFPAVQAEYDDTHVLTFMSYASFVLMLDRPVHNLNDLKGLKLWSQGKPRNDTCVALGAVPVSMPMGDAYMAIQKGVLNGLISDSTLLVSRKMGEVTKHVTTGVSLGTAPFSWVMNKRKWNSLPQDIQQVFNDLGGDWLAEHVGGTFDQLKVEAYNEWKDTVTWYTLPAAEAERWTQRLAATRDKYIEWLEAKGVPAKEILAEMLAASKEFGGAHGRTFPAQQPY